MKKIYTLIASVFVTAATFAQCTDLFFSEYIEGSSNNKALEIYNPTSGAVNLTGYKVQLYNNGNVLPNTTFQLSGTIAAGDVYVICNSQSNDSIKAKADTTSGVANFNGDDAISLVNGTVTIDIIGVIGTDPGTSWTVGSGATADYTLVRMNSVHGGTVTWSQSQNEWDVFPMNDSSHLGSHSMSACTLTDTLVRFTPNADNVSEGVGTYDVNLALNTANHASPFTVEVVLNGGTGDASDINNYTTQTVTFPANSATASLTLTVTDDANPEPSETLIFKLANPSGVLKLGTDSIFTLTIGSSDNPIQTVQISDITGLNANYQPDSLGKQVIVSGTVYGIDLRSTGLQFFIHDATDGIQVLSGSNTFGYTVAEGDSVVVSGTVGFSNGMTRLNSLDSLFKIGTHALNSPTVVPDLDENSECELVRLNNVHLVTPSQWDTTGQPGGFGADITDGVNNWKLYIDEQTDIFKNGQAAPVGDFDVIGMGSQYDTSSPYTSGYELIPRYHQDIIVQTAVNELSGNSFSIYPNPNNGTFVLELEQAAEAEVKLYDINGRIVYAAIENKKSIRVNTSELSKGIYIVEIKTAGNAERSKVVIE